MKRYLLSRTASFMALFLLLMFPPLVSKASGSDQATGQSIIIAYTGNTWGYIVPCPA